jgi:sporulation-control protein spo0M
MSNTLPTCDWQENDLGWWNTDCDNAHVFIDDGPIYNEFKFCPYSGKPLTETPYDEHAAE